MDKKKISALAYSCLLCISSVTAQEDFSIRMPFSVKVHPGGEDVEVCVTIESENPFTAYELDLLLPEGVNLAKDAEGQYRIGMCTDSGLYPAGGTQHVFKYSYNEVEKNTIRICCYSPDNAVIGCNGNLLKFYVNSSPYTQPFVLDVLTSSNIHVVNTEATQKNPYTYYTPLVSLVNPYTVQVNIAEANKLGTLVVPFAVSEMPAGLKAYIVDHTVDGTVYLKASATMDAFTPYILYAENGYSGSLSGEVPKGVWTDCAETLPLIGTLRQTDVTDAFVLQDKGNGPAFYRVPEDKTVNIPEGLCYLSLKDFTGDMATLSFEDATGVTVTGDEPASSAAVLYTVEGTRVSKGVPGRMYIYNGKKIIYQEGQR